MNAETILRKAAAEIRSQNINGWGNACEAGADRIAELEAELAEIRRHRWERAQSETRAEQK